MRARMESYSLADVSRREVQQPARPRTHNRDSVLRRTVIQGSREDLGMPTRRYELTDFEWSIIEPLLPNKPRGVPRADDRRVLNGIYWRLRTGSPWADISERYGPATTCYHRLVRLRQLRGWDLIYDAVYKYYVGDLPNYSYMI